MGVRDNILTSLGLTRLDAIQPPADLPPEIVEALEHIDQLGAAPSSMQGWAQLFTSLGMGSHDPTAGMGYTPRPLLTPAQAEDLYGHGGVARNIINRVVDDGSRKGYTINVKAQEGESARDAAQVGDDIKAYLATRPVTVDALQVEHGALLALNRTTKWARLYGGAAMLLGLDDAQQVDQPLSPSQMKGISFIRVVPMTFLRPVSLHEDPTQAEFGTVKEWQITANAGSSSAVPGASTQQLQTWHSDRVIPIAGEQMPPGMSTANKAPWGFSTYDVGLAELRGAMSGDQIGDGLIQRSTFLAWKIKGLKATLQAGNEGKMLGRVQAFMRSLSTLRAAVIDKDNEDIVPLAFDMRGINTYLERKPFVVASAFNYPASILYSIQTGGLNNSGPQSDIDNYNDGFVRALIQEAKWRSPLERLIFLAMLSSDGPTNGTQQDVALRWNPLDELTELEAATVRKTQAETDQIYIQNLVTRIEEIRQSRFSGRDFSTDTQIEGPAPGLQVPDDEAQTPGQSSPAPSEQEEATQPTSSNEDPTDGQDST